MVPISESPVPGAGARRRVAVFKPYNARRTSAFYGAQHTLFKYLQERSDMDFTYIVDDPAVSFDGVHMAYVRRSRLGTLLTGAYKFFVSDQVRYPFYRDVDFEQFDVVITEGIYYSLLEYVRGCAAKVILNDSLSWDPRFRSSRARYLNHYFRRSRAVVVTEKVRSIYEQYGIEIPATVIGHPTDVAGIAFRKRVAPPRRLASVGRLVREKGFQVIIDAVTQVAHRYPGVTLDVFGAGPLREELTDLIRRNRMQAVIQLKGYVPREALLERLDTYDLFVSHPLTIRRFGGTGFAEPFLMANFEAMATGLPVITSDCGGVPYAVRDAAMVVRQTDVGALRDAIGRFVSGVEQVEARSLGGRQFVEANYALERIAAQWRAVVESVCAR